MKRPTVPAPLPWDFPTPVTATLDNGLRVLIFQRPGQHLVTATLVLDLPLSLEPADREGVSTILQRCLDEGTASHPGTEFADRLEGCGAVLTGSSSHTGAQLSLEVPSTRFAAALPLFAEAVREPQLADADVRRHRELRLAEIAQQQAHPTHRGALAFRGAVIQDRFRASRPAGGTADSVAAITADDVRAHHRAHYGPARGTLVLAGDFGVDPLGLVQDAFGDWVQPVSAVQHEIPLPPASPRALLIDRPGAVQADVRLGRFGLDRLDPDYTALRLGCFVLGGGFLSRLNRVLREERGYTYGIQLANAPARSGGMLALHASFRTEVAAAAVAEASELLRVDGDRRLTAAELTDAVNFLIGISPLRCATASGIGDQAAALAEVGLGTDFVNAHTAALQRVTPEQATEAVARHLPGDGLTLVVVGDADALADPLRSAGYRVEVG
ncbi:MAG: pitrilysin family protein [Micropruina sp.]|uniref:M16 family metallopeptidase n=1 Tax=Micropruina sp. TaxID=2737536 RepID=UPI0039E64F44